MVMDEVVVSSVIFAVAGGVVLLWSLVSIVMHVASIFKTKKAAREIESGLPRCQ
jgi:hypothetical protein